MMAARRKGGGASRRLDAHRYSATANDVVGTGTGEAHGNAFRWEYTVALQPGNPLSHVRLKQWMYLQDDGRIVLNRGTIRKFGLQVAQVSEVLRREFSPDNPPVRFTLGAEGFPT